jgi:hypothetical protein
MKTITINSVEYVPVEDCHLNSDNPTGDYVIVRTSTAGVFAGYLKVKDGDEVTLRNARRLWKWAGAATLSQLAMEGTSTPAECKFPCEVIEETIKGWIEIIPTTMLAKESILAVPVWSA